MTEREPWFPARRPPFDSPLERALFWAETVTRPVHDHNRSNDEMVEVEARDLYNLLHAVEAYDESRASHSQSVPRP